MTDEDKKELAEWRDLHMKMFCNPFGNPVFPCDDYSQKPAMLAYFFTKQNERIKELEDAVRNLHKVKGRYHTQQSCERLFELVGLVNNIGELVERGRKSTQEHHERVQAAIDKGAKLTNHKINLDFMPLDFLAQVRGHPNRLSNLAYVLITAVSKPRLRSEVQDNALNWRVSLLSPSLS